MELPSEILPAELTIVIPSKNESSNLPCLLRCISQQDYPHLASTRVFVADAGSTDGTVELALAFQDKLKVEIIPGGLPAVGRNNGARLATTPYLLFMDADIEFHDSTLLRRTMETMRRRHLQCLTVDIRCSNGNLIDHLIYFGNNAIQHFASFTKPFATGMFMLFEKAKFDELGGFNEKALFAEDYLLSKNISPLRFGICKGYILTSNRRFVKIGRFKMIRMFFRTMLNTFNEKWFLRDQHYWQDNTKKK